MNDIAAALTLSDYGQAFPASRKVYVEAGGGIHVPMREIALSGGEPPLRVYDTSGPLGADVLARLPDHSVKRIDELLPWNWVPGRRTATTWQRSATPCRPTP